MGREFDCRNFDLNHASASRESELLNLVESVSNRLAESHRVRIERFGAMRGNPVRVISEGSPGESGNYIQRAVSHIKDISPILGFAADQLVEFVADEDYQTTSDGAVAVHLQQSYKGLNIFEATQVVRFSPEGVLSDTLGETARIEREIDPTPQITVSDAVQKAAEHVAVPGDDEHEVDHFGEPLNYTPLDFNNASFEVVEELSEGPEQTCYCDPGPFEDRIKAGLIWFELDGDLRLAWEILMTLPNAEGQYRTLVDANDGSILYCHQLMLWIAGRGNVFQVDGSQNRRMIDFPRPLLDYGLPVPDDLPASMPDDWIDSARSIGNNVNAHLGSNGPGIDGELQNGQAVFNPAIPDGDDQKVLNIFYYNAYMHDFFYLLGYRERDGNFQQNNFNRGGLASDRVDARAHSGPVFGTANMATQIDGRSPVMNMGLVSSTNRHTAFDSSVVFHEFMHGVTNRLVGGPANARALDAPQSGGMGEGWGDYIACSINQNDTVGSWVMNRTLGIRGFRYDSNFPDHFGDLGSGRYTQIHNIGEIWAATLLDMNRRIGMTLALQLVVDALKLSPASPGFLDMRDAILTALENHHTASLIDAVTYRDALGGIWAVFAGKGMGPNARSNGASLSGIVADFNVPPEPQPDPEPDPGPAPGGPIVVIANQPIPDAQPRGISSQLLFPASGSIEGLTVTVDIQHTYIGDLKVKLTSPGGTTVELHSQTGGSRDDLNRSFTIDSTPVLAAFIGQNPEGNWTLHVADLVGQDLGVLREWSLDIISGGIDDIVRARATPGLSIPDFSVTGVRSTIPITRDGIIKTISVDVKISHTYIGDLQVSLTAPDGTTIQLHNRSGGSTDNLIKTYSSSDTTELADIEGGAVRGNWTLWVVDRAQRDVGILEEWGLEIETGEGPRVVIQEVNPNIPVPDNNPTGISSAITVNDAGLIAVIAIEVDIPHTYIGDLRVTLNGPDGTTIVLHNGTGGSADNLIKRYSDSDTPALTTMLGKQGQGIWTLKVADLLGQDRGTLQRWKIEMEYA